MKKSSNGPPFGSFQGKNKNCSSFAKMIRASRRSFFCKLGHFWVALWTKKMFPSQNCYFENRATNSWDIYCSGWVGGWVGGWIKVEIMLASALVEVEIELSWLRLAIIRVIAIFDSRAHFQKNFRQLVPEL